MCMMPIIEFQTCKPLEMLLFGKQMRLTITINTGHWHIRFWENNKYKVDYAYTNKELYNGNIKSMVTSLINTNGVNLDAHLNNDTYDQLNRIKRMTNYEFQYPVSSPVAGIESRKKIKECFFV